jgi:hypothetical protein
VKRTIRYGASIVQQFRRRARCGQCTLCDSEFDFQRGERLTDLVVQLARNRPPFFFLRRQQLRRQPLEITSIVRLSHALPLNAALETPDVQHGENANGEADHDGQPKALPESPLGRAVDARDLTLLAHERRAVQRLDLLGNANDAFALRHDTSAQRRRVDRPATSIGREDFKHGLPEVFHFCVQPRDLFALPGRIDHGDVLTQCLLRRSRALLQRGTILIGHHWIRVEKRVADVDRSEQHLTAGSGQKLLRTHVSLIDGGGAPLDVGHATRQIVPGEQPGAQNQTDAEHQRRFDRRSRNGRRRSREAPYRVAGQFHGFMLPSSSVNAAPLCSYGRAIHAG